MPSALPPEPARSPSAYAGNIKQAVGKAVGDQKTVAAGKTEAAEGKVQNAVGGIKDAIRSITNRIGSIRRGPVA